MGRRSKVLVVDDEPGWGELMVDVLDMEGYDVACAEDGVQAVPLLSTFAPDVVLTDLQMPRMDGHELLTRVCAFDAQLPVVIATSDKKAADASGVGAAFRVLTKPVPLEELLSVLAAAAAQHEALRHVPWVSHVTGMFKKVSQMRIVFVTVAMVTCAAVVGLGFRLKDAA